MTYIHPTAGLVVRSTAEPVDQHEARCFINQAKKRTSGPIHTISSGTLLWDCVESIVVSCLEQTVEGCRHHRVREIKRATCEVSVRAGNRLRGRLVRSKAPFPRFDQQHPKTGFFGETSGEDTARGSCGRLLSAEGPRETQRETHLLLR